MITNLRFTAFCLASALLAGTAHSAVVITVAERIVNPAGTGTPNTLTSTTGTISMTDTTLAGTTYTITGVDLTSVGGTASETIAFDVTYTQTGGTGLQYTTFGNVAVTGNANNTQIDPQEALTATLSLNGATTFTGPGKTISLAFNFVGFGGFTGGDVVDLITSNGTTTYAGTTAAAEQSIADTTYMTLDTTAGNLNLQSFDVKITAVPEPSVPAFAGLLGMLALVRRRR